MAENNFSALVQLIVDKAQARTALQRELKELQKEAQLETDVKINLSDVKQARKEIAQANREQQEGTRENIKLRAQELAHARMVAKETKVATDLEIANRQREMKLSNQAMSEELANRKRVAQEQKVATQEELASRESIRKLNEQTFKEESSARRQAIAEMKLQAQEQRAMKSSLQGQADKIQLSLSGQGKIDYNVQIKELTKQFQDLGFTEQEVAQKMQPLIDKQKELKDTIDNNDFDSVVAKNQAIINADEERTKALNQVRNAYKDLKSDATQYYNLNKQTKLSTDIQNWLSKNTAASKTAKQSLQEYYRELSSGRVSVDRLEYIEKELKTIDAEQRGLGKLGKNLKDQFSQAAESFTQWISVSSAIMGVVYKTKEAVTELKEVNTLLTEISKANENLSKTDLEDIGNNSFDVASKYGKTATDYLSGVQEASRAGYENAEGIAELSVAAQGAGDMTAELSNQLIIATDKAYKMGGSVTELKQVLDGMNYITNHNAVNMTNLSEGMSIVGSTAASLGVDVDQLAAAIGTMSATTQQSGSEVARAFKAILLNIRQVSDEEENIDAEGLTKYEKACNALGVSLKETKNGVLQTRDAMEVLKELSVEYNKLSENDIRRTDLLNSVGGKLRSTQLDALLRQWDTYESMLQQYKDGAGSMDKEAEKTANSWEGSMNRLSNTWTKTIGHIANSDAIIETVNGLNSLLSVVDKITGSLGSLGTIGLGVSGILGVKGLGLTNYVTMS